jgi:hypothetical protein
MERAGAGAGAGAALLVVGRLLAYAICAAVSVYCVLSLPSRAGHDGNNKKAEQ